MIILVLNNGSSSLKFQLVTLSSDPPSENLLASGVVERIGGEALLTLKVADKSSKETAPLRDTTQALNFVIKALLARQSELEGFSGLADINAVGHRVVHGGEQFKASVVVDDEVLKELEDCIELAPLHNPANIRGINAMREILGAGIPQVAVFDTAFHSTMPEHAWLYALPYSTYRRHKIRRYGFHGTSCRYITERYRQLANVAEDDCNIIIFHLGNGCSASAIRAGKSIDTSMGMTPTEGLVMGSRSGDVDPSVLEMIGTKEGLSFHEVQAMLNRQSGLLGISGITSDMRDLIDEVEENKDRRAQLAIDIFCYRARKYLGSYLAAIGPVKAVIFCGGIGENSPLIRERIVSGLDHLGIKIDISRNAQPADDGILSAKDSVVELRVIPTDEEIMIARDTKKLIEKSRRP